ncbi:MAG: chromosomal replication initiator protein DnaA [Atopobiaceae bacterium]|nr:chromosomal replication initiator protein DnaA [Atopobiaceae bacterium]
MDTTNESDAEALWDDIISTLEAGDLPASTTAMLKSCKASSMDDESLHVLTTSRFVQRTLARIAQDLDDAATDAAFTQMSVVVELGRAEPKRQRPERAPMRPAPAPVQPPEATVEKRAAPEPNPLVEDLSDVGSTLTFDRFVEGPQNKFALDAAKQVANGSRNYNPLFIYGKSGLGKTHLLRAIQNYIAQNDPERLCAYRVATDFIDDYTKAMKNARTGAAEALAANYHAIDVLIIDDIQLMSTAAGTIGFFYDTFNYLINHGKQIVLAADRTPSELGMGQSRFDERVTSRLDSGMTVSIQVPDYELKLQLIDAFYERMRADAREQRVPGIDAHIDESLRRRMAELAGTNIRVIEGYVQSCLMLAYQREAAGEHLTEEDVVSAAEQKWPSGQRRVTVDKIQEAVERSYGIDHAQLVGAKRNKELMEPRHIAIWLTRELTDNTLADIGKHFGGRTHATVKHSIGVIEEGMREDRVLQDRVARIRDQILE